jgi:hypothetical protein
VRGAKAVSAKRERIDPLDPVLVIGGNVGSETDGPISHVEPMIE